MQAQYVYQQVMSMVFQHQKQSRY